MHLGNTATPAADETADGRSPGAGAAPFLATHGAVEARPGAGGLRFRATHRWDQGARDAADATSGSYGDEPPPESLDLLPHAIAACITAGMASIVRPPLRSMLAPPRAVLLAVAAGVPLLAGAWLALWNGTYDEPFTRTGWRCFALTALTAPWPFAALVLGRDRVEPRHPAAAGAALGAVAGAWAAVMVELWCPLSATSHVVVGHVLLLAALALAGAAIGARALRLRRLQVPERTGAASGGARPATAGGPARPHQDRGREAGDPLSR